MTVRTQSVTLLRTAGVLVALLAVTYLFFVRTFAGQIIDERAVLGAHRFSGPFLGLIGSILEGLPVYAVLIGLVMTTVIVLVRRSY